MNNDSIVNMAQLREFIKLSHGVTFNKQDKAEAYEWIGKTLSKFRYFKVSKGDRGVVKRYIRSMTGYSNAQVDRLITRKKKTGRVYLKERTQPTFPRIYTPEDIALLCALDNAKERRTGGAVRKTLADMYTVYQDERFVRLAKISVSHIYNLRGTRQYETRSLTYTKTCPVSNTIGVRKKPTPNRHPRVNPWVSIPHVERYLKPNVTVASLKKRMMEQSHFAAAEEMRRAKTELFNEIKKQMV